MAKRWAPMLVALLVAANGLTAGASLDDWMHHALVHGELAKRAWWDLFNFADGRPETMSDLISRGPFPWFTLPELKLRFFRPLSSALLQLDTLVFKDALWLAHVHSTLWYLGLVALCRALYRRLVPAVALLAAVLFALDDSHTMPVVWLANRNSLISVAFAWLGLWAHLRWREDAWKPGAPLSWLAYVTALLAGETGIAAMAYVVAYELIGRRDSVRARALALVPAVSVVVAFTLLYKALGMGASGSATYIDPGSEPLVFLANAPTRFLANLGGQSTGFVADLWLFLPQFRPHLIALGVIALGVWPVAWTRWAPREEDARRTLSWLGLGAALSIIPPLATFPATRLMIAPSLGLMAVVGTLLTAAWKDAGVRRGLGVFWLGFAFVVQPLVTWFTMPGTFRFIAEQTTSAVLAADVKEGERTIIVTTSDFAPAIYGVPLLLEVKRPVPRSWQVWSMAPLAHRLTRLSEREFTLTALGGQMTQSIFEQNFRESTTRPLAVGDSAQLEGQVIRVTAVEGGAPTSIHIALLLPPEAFHFVKWTERGLLETMTLPNVGETLDIPRVDTLFERDLLGRR